MKRILLLGTMLCFLGGAVDAGSQTFRMEVKKGFVLCADFEGRPPKEAPLFLAFNQSESLLSLTRPEQDIGILLQLTGYFEVSPLRMEFVGRLSERVIWDELDVSDTPTSVFIAGNMNLDEDGEAVSVKARIVIVEADVDEDECLSYAKLKSVERIE